MQPAAWGAIGIDLVLKDTAGLSTGEIIVAPKPLAAKRATLRRYPRGHVHQRDASMVRAGLDLTQCIRKGTRIAVSNRMRRCKAQIGALHARITDARRDHQHQLNASVTARANVIAIEDLNVKGTARGMGRRSFR